LYQQEEQHLESRQTFTH